MTIAYTVKFRPGRYKIARADKLAKEKTGSTALAQPTWIVGREDDSSVIGFFFEEEAAKQVCYALNLSDAYLRGDKSTKLDLLRSIEKLAAN